MKGSQKKRIIDYYAEFVAEHLFRPGYEPSSHLIDDVRLLLAGIAYGGDHTVVFVDYSGREIEVNAKTILRWLDSASESDLRLFEERLMRKLSRMRSSWEDSNYIERRLREISDPLDVPIDVIRYEKTCYRDLCVHEIKIGIGTKTYWDVFEGDLEELISILIDVAKNEARVISRIKREAQKARNRIGEDIKRFLNEIERYVYKNAILTISGSRLSRLREWRNMPDGVLTLYMGLRKIGDIEILAWDVMRLSNNQVVYGANPKYWPEFYRWLEDSLRMNRMLSIILRSFLDTIDEESGLPYKEIRGYILTMTGDRAIYTQLPAQELRQALTTDPETRRKLPPEPAVIYCGPGDDRIVEGR